MSIVDDDIESNISGNESFEQVVEQRLSRRSLLGGGVAMAVTASLGGVGTLMQAMPASAHGRHWGKGPGKGPKSLLGFKGIAEIPEDMASLDTIRVPEGYSAEVLIAWGDPVSKGPRFKQDASNSAEDQEKQWGMHNDGMVYFPLRGSNHGLLVQNHEYTDDELLFPDGTANWDAEKTRKSLAAHGVGIVEVKKIRGKWQVIRPSIVQKQCFKFLILRVQGKAAHKQQEQRRNDHPLFFHFR
jgi:secreted PhoX family phosphatase